MNTKKQYSLPNCNLILEGLEDSDIENADILSGQAPMSILINAECHLLKSNQKLSGGSVFLTNLSHAVSNYAQGFLSGLFAGEKLKSNTAEYPQVSITKVADRHLHRLTLEPKPDSGEAKTEVEMTTVELFDLVDAIDQFHADRSVLPNMTLELRSVSKRYLQPEKPLAERATPLVIGLSSLAIAAGALFMLPIPDAPIEPASTNQTTEIETEPESETENSTPSDTSQPTPEN
ncbi:MAG: DUF4335 domain-containing protein [Cyanobacteria bacterium P01_C01_bin.72]